MSYTTSTLVGNYLQRALTADETAFLAILIPAIGLWINSKLNSNFDTAVESTRYYDGGTSTIDIDPCTLITDVDSVGYDNTESFDYTDLTDYVAEPVNATIKNELRRRGGGHFPKGIANIKVTATFTEYDGAVPYDIQSIATMLAAGALGQGSISGSGGGAVAEESLEGHSVKYDTASINLEGISASNPAIMSLIEQRRELYVG